MYTPQSIQQLKNSTIDVYHLAGGRIHKDIPVSTANEDYWQDLAKTYSTQKFQIRVYGANGNTRIEKKQLKGIVEVSTAQTQSQPTYSQFGAIQSPQLPGDYHSSTWGKNIFQDRINELTEKLKKSERENEELRLDARKQAYKIIDLEAEIKTNDLRTMLEKERFMSEQKSGLSGITDSFGKLVDKLIDKPELMGMFLSKMGNNIEIPATTGNNAELEFLLEGLAPEELKKMMYCIKILANNPHILDELHAYYLNQVNIAQAKKQTNDQPFDHVN